MNINLDRVILSTNEDPKYSDFVLWIVRAWKKLFNVKVTLAVQSKDHNLFVKYKCCDDIIFFSDIEGIPSANLSKVIRLIAATYYNADVCLINDIDLLPLQTNYVKNILSQRKAGELLCVGIDTYKGTPDEGKTPLGYLSGEGHVFRELINPNESSYEELIKSWVGQKVFDDKEDISSLIHNENPNCFSDESLVRLLISRWKNAKVKYIERGFIVGEDSIDRSKWKIDINKLKKGEYIESHLLRPFSKHKDEILKLIYYLGIA